MRPTRGAAWAAAALLAAGCAGAPAEAPGAAAAGAAAEPRLIEGTLESGGEVRDYRLHLPPGEGPPVVIALHGKGSSAADMDEFNGLTGAALESGLAVAYPQGLHEGWGDHRVPTELRPDPGADVAFLTALAGELAAEYGIDPDRVYLAGQSNGANMALRAAVEEPGVFAGVAAVAGQLPLDPEPMRPAEATPLLMVYGTEDPLRPYEGLPEVPPGGGSGEFAEPPITTIGTRETAESFADANGAAEEETEALPDTDPEDGTTVERTSWHDGGGPPPVVLYTVDGGGHTWPGAADRFADIVGVTSRDIDAGALIAEFFAGRG
ncbi:alpha/beta hydrolase family esterase [Allonocardiopsis opalescens]|uniref:Polyhydroxybutyrate depolymerase n=1 Tax=Allonocardiopsis opalescens TaxID=1144618 RepID=A0A2T0Q6L6_9ACTN|nr:PHB depolymerase family esterase [Allonocardiopsis opalescens]PRX99444.1 polyhydroxybutyrate depolymerase [Allonocardiopsis opalescens]